MNAEDLTQFTGTERYYRWNPMIRAVLTDGAKFLADHVQAFWLMDVIGSYLPRVKDTFAIAWLYKIKDEWCFRLLSDFPIADDTVEWAHQKILYSDFPLDEVKLYVVNDGTQWVIMLPSEY